MSCGLDVGPPARRSYPILGIGEPSGLMTVPVSVEFDPRLSESPMGVRRHILAEMEKEAWEVAEGAFKVRHPKAIIEHQRESD